jgi:transporter family-2 protein
MQAYWPHLLAVLVGVGLTVQVGMNSTLGRAVGSSLWAAVGNFSVGLVALVACAALFSGRVATGSIAQVPGWAWWGGLFGASYVASATMLGPRLGAVALLVLVLAGQLVSALWVDQFGVLGFPRIPVTPLRLLGAALVVVGAVLVVRR